MADTNPFANNQQQQQQTPSYLQQQNNPSMAGQISNMVKALMSGNDQFKQGQQLQQMIAARQANPAIGQAAAAMGPQPGAPMSILPPAQAAAMGAPPTPATPAAGAAAPGGTAQPSMTPTTGAMTNPQTPPIQGTDAAFGAGASPVNIDPMTAALFSPIPGDMGAMGGGLGS